MVPLTVRTDAPFESCEIIMDPKLLPKRLKKWKECARPLLAKEFTDRSEFMFQKIKDFLHGHYIIAAIFLGITLLTTLLCLLFIMNIDRDDQQPYWYQTAGPRKSLPFLQHWLMGVTGVVLGCYSMHQVHHVVEQYLREKRRRNKREVHPLGHHGNTETTPMESCCRHLPVA